MTEILLFHHAQGLTPGMLTFADELRRAGHTVHTPDLYSGHVFDSLEDGMAYAEGLGFDRLLSDGVEAAAEHPADLLYVGISLGVMPAQKLAQTRRGARGAVLISACVDPRSFGAWPAELPAEIHAMAGDPFWTDEGDADAAQALAEANPGVRVFTYPGDQHLFNDASLPSFEREAAALATQHILEFAERVGG